MRGRNRLFSRFSSLFLAFSRFCSLLLAFLLTLVPSHCGCAPLFTFTLANCHCLTASQLGLEWPNLNRETLLH
ncbi:hypothetical protein B0H67DRAFT_571859 [Lasiosphaeris hirsuta]|uniref:Uncharacterized protein n=1 Tax=Lasiosphaeris hirsuta TaxID=260670 RepID=A0AA40B1E4_9PEZI|nr:hypothetical protein B0H67DRAFT_571859 [Lasiosphaeris hirsuta]